MFLMNAQQRQMPGMEEVNPVWEGWLRISVVMSMVAAIALITSGAGLLGLRRWGRVLAIGYAVYAIANCVLGVVMQYVFVTQPLLEQNAGGAGQQAALITVGASLVGSCIGLIYPLLLWYFMSRPHVVAAFNGLSMPVDCVQGILRRLCRIRGLRSTPAIPMRRLGRRVRLRRAWGASRIPRRNRSSRRLYRVATRPHWWRTTAESSRCFPCLGFPLGVVAVIYGLKGLRAERENPAVRGGVHAWVGVICGALFGFFNFLLCVAVVIGIFAAMIGTSLTITCHFVAGELVSWSS